MIVVCLGSDRCLGADKGVCLMLTVVFTWVVTTVFVWVETCLGADKSVCLGGDKCVCLILTMVFARIKI